MMRMQGARGGGAVRGTPYARPGRCCAAGAGLARRMVVRARCGAHLRRLHMSWAMTGTVRPTAFYASTLSAWTISPGARTVRPTPWLCVCCWRWHLWSRSRRSDRTSRRVRGPGCRPAEVDRAIQANAEILSHANLVLTEQIQQDGIQHRGREAHAALQLGVGDFLLAERVDHRAGARKIQRLFDVEPADRCRRPLQLNCRCGIKQHLPKP